MKRRNWKSKLPALILALGLASQTTIFAMTAQEYDRIMEDVAELQEEGSLSKAENLVEEALAQEDLTVGQRRELEYEIERSRRIRMDYTVTEERLKEILDGRIEGMTEEEFDRWVDEGRFDMKMIDGEKRFVNPSASNLLFRYEDVAERRRDPRPTAWRDYLYEHAMEVKENVVPAEGTAEARNYHIEMTISVDGGTIPQGQKIQCWMPFPQQFAAQNNVKLLDATPTVSWVNAPDYPMRSLYFEQPSKGPEPTVFRASYSVSVHPRYYDIDPARVASVDQESAPGHAEFLREEPPHVVFTPRIRNLAEEIVGGETNPAIKARLIYDWVCENLKYSYAREYSTLRCIPEYVLDGKYGDCGQIALLYISLCRAAGVPARWQSGWVIYPQFQNLHDWTEIYLAPYGWVPVDPNFGVEIYRYFDNLNEEEREELRQFFFGGMDAYRLTVNRIHGYPHYPPKKDFRSDNVDFQRGELESNGENIYFDKFSYRLKTQFLDSRERRLWRKSEGKLPVSMLSPNTAR